MNWLEWSTIDLKNGLGGVEVHARSLARELEKHGIEVSFSMDPDALEDPHWDVVHTHGSAPGRRGQGKAIRVHTLHGTTLGRMAACGEWTWIGGYAAAARELRGVYESDIVMSVHPYLSLYSLARKLGKKTAICWNGWDPSDLPQATKDLSSELKTELQSKVPFWLYVGRGADRTKGADRLQKTMALMPDLQWVAAPGDGFEHLAKVKKTGKLSAAQVRELMSMASGLVLPSRYEGHSLVILEALAQGLPTVATQVGGVPVLPEGIEGLVKSDSGDPRALADAIRSASRFDVSTEARIARANVNRGILPRWENVAQSYLSAVKDFGLSGRTYG